MSKARMKTTADASSLAGIVKAYLRERGHCPPDELQSFADEADLEAAVARAARAERPNGKRYNHQRRLTAVAIAAMQANLVAADFKDVSTFHDLWVLVKEKIGGVPGVGE